MARNKTLSALCILLFIFATGLAGGLKGRMGKNTVKNSDLDLGSKVWVKKPDGSMSCDQATDTHKEGVKDDHKEDHASETAASVLKKEGINVFEFKKTNDGQMRAAVCGIPTGNEDSFLISEKDLAKATALGFSRVSK